MYSTRQWSCCLNLCRGHTWRQLRLIFPFNCCQLLEDLKPLKLLFIENVSAEKFMIALGNTRFYQIECLPSLSPKKRKFKAYDSFVKKTDFLWSIFSTTRCKQNSRHFHTTVCNKACVFFAALADACLICREEPPQDLHLEDRVWLMCPYLQVGQQEQWDLIGEQLPPPHVDTEGV